nr:hypothetical protein CFP56_20708 [Quercus suber]
MTCQPYYFAAQCSAAAGMRLIWIIWQSVSACAAFALIGKYFSPSLVHELDRSLAHPFRPGKGGSHPISSLSERVPLWLETVPLVLKDLGIERLAAVMSHSAGTIYALNTLYHLRHLLALDNPIVAMIAPYVDNTHSQAMLTNFLVKLPSNVLSAWDPLTRFINQRIMPLTNWSGNLLEGSNRSPSSSGGQDVNGEAMIVEERYGVDEKVAKDIEKGMMRFLLTEDTSAVNQEVLLCLKKGGEECWGVAEDYEQFVQRVMEKENEVRRSCHTLARLTVKVWFAESDVMSGKGGQDYFEACWKQSGVEEMVDFESVVLAGTNHDSIIIDHKKGALRSVFELVAGRSEGG